MLKSRFKVVRIDRVGSDPLKAGTVITMDHVPSMIPDAWMAKTGGTIAEYTADNCRISLGELMPSVFDTLVVCCVDGVETKEFDLGMEVEIAFTPIKPVTMQDGETGI